MEIALTLEQEAQLSSIAMLKGKTSDEVALEVLLRGLEVETMVVSSNSGRVAGRDVAARMLELRRTNMLPDGVTIEAMLRDGRS